MTKNEIRTIVLAGREGRRPTFTTRVPLSDATRLGPKTFHLELRRRVREPEGRRKS